MAYKWENGKVVRVSLPKKLSAKNAQALEEYWQKTDVTNHPWRGTFKDFGIKVIYDNKKI
jgi:hypothetical protein